MTKKQSKTIKRNKEHIKNLFSYPHTKEGGFYLHVKEPVESPSSLERQVIDLFTSYLKKER